MVLYLIYSHCLSDNLISMALSSASAYTMMQTSHPHSVFHIQELSSSIIIPNHSDLTLPGRLHRLGTDQDNGHCGHCSHGNMETRLW